jgi:hypothetical protein
MNAAQSYSYIPLSSSPSIRLLILEASASFDDQLICSLREVRLDSSTPPYHALSYVWGAGNQTKMESMLVRTPSGSYGHLPITPNCDVAIRHLRLGSEARAMWVDAICINQKSIAEKNYQVSMMEKIYYLASRVLVWLDISYLDSRQAKSALRHLNRQGLLFSKNTLRLHPEDKCERSRMTTLMCEKYCKLRCMALAGRLSISRHETQEASRSVSK